MTKNNKHIIEQLHDIGLKQNEAEIYLFLLENGLSTPPQIAKATSIARTNCYNILKSLLEKDVVNEQMKGKKKIYTARDPKSLKLNLERKMESINRLLPDLEALHKTQKNKPLFRFYDGFDELRFIYEQSLEAQEIYSIASIEGLHRLDSQFFEEYNKKCTRKNIRFHDILTAGSRKSAEIIENIQDKNHTIQFLPPEYSENITEMLMWDDNIALISLETPIFGTIITSKPLANTLRTIFKFISSKL